MTFLLVVGFLLAGVFVIDAEECKDRATLCGKLVTYCDKKNYGTWMRANCQVTCGFCVVKTTEAAPPTPEPTHAPIITNLPIIPGYCGVPQVQGKRVVGGKDATKGSWPWQILMLFNGYPSCGGALISPNWVVSAAHCVYGDEGYPNLFTIRTGEHNRDIIELTETEYEVDKVIPHPDYDPNKLNNDIALLRLERPAVFNKYVLPVCLPDEPAKVGDDCYITGWGKTKSTGTMTKILQQGKLPVVSQETCNKLNMKNIKIPVTKAMICGGNGGASTLSGCHGDSGGPYVCKKDGRWFLQGAVSHGSSRCNSTETYTVFSKVYYFRDWIEEMMATE